MNMLNVVDTLPEKLTELEQQRKELQQVILEVQEELEQAKVRQKSTGEYMAADEFARLRTIVRNDTSKLHELNRDIKELHKQLSRANPKAAYFQQAAKKILSLDKYEEVNNLANRWMKK